MCRSNHKVETAFQAERLMAFCEAGLGIPETLYDLVIVSRDGQAKRATFTLDRHQWEPPRGSIQSKLHVWYSARFTPFERDFELVAIQHVKGGIPNVTCSIDDLEGDRIPRHLRRDETFTFQFPFTVHGAANLGIYRERRAA